MPHAQAFAGKDFTIEGKEFFVGLFAWPDSTMPETYFAAIMDNDSMGTWTTLLQLPPITKDLQNITPAQYGINIMDQFNVKIAELLGVPVSESQIWNLELKKLFDGLFVENNLIKLPVAV